MLQMLLHCGTRNTAAQIPPEHKSNPNITTAVLTLTVLRVYLHLPSLNGPPQLVLLTRLTLKLSRSSLFSSETSSSMSLVPGSWYLSSMSYCGLGAYLQRKTCLNPWTCTLQAALITQQCGCCMQGLC